VEEFSLDVAMAWVDMACGGFFAKEEAGTLKPTDVYLFRVAQMLEGFAIHGAVLLRYSRTVGKLAADQARILSVWELGEVTKILEAVDRANPSGKRDYAIILLITRLGLRGIDMKRLGFSDLDRPGNQQSVVQAKTGHRVQLPLPKTPAERSSTSSAPAARDATTRLMSDPTVRHATRNSSTRADLAVWVTNQATWSSKSRL